MARLLEDRGAEIAALIVRETGGIPGKAEYEVGAAQNELYEAAALASRATAEVLPSHNPGKMSLIQRLPVGVVAAITPWNFPVVLGFRVVAPALALGNTVVLKPAPETPATGALIIAELFAEAGAPAGVLQALPGDDDTGKQLVAHPAVNMIHFTGSSEVGRQIAISAAGDLKRVSLELGGNNAFVVLDDADVDEASMVGAWSAFHYSGQTCITAGRHIVARSLFDDYVDRMSTRARGIEVGDPSSGEVGLGPMISESQVARAHGIVEESVAMGAKVVEGGTYDGLFYRPTVMVDVTPEMPVWSRGDLRSGGSGARRGLRGRGARAGQRHAVRAGQRRVHRGGRARAVVRRTRPLGDGARERLHLPRRGSRAVRRRRGLGHRRALRGRGEPRGVHRAPLDRGAAHPGRVPVLVTDPDVLIVGAGPSGAIAAKRLAEAGMSVVCLEQGGWPDYERARSAHPDYELTSGVHWAWDPNVRDGPGDYPIDDSESDITALMWNGVGGGTVVFAAHWQRNLPSDFRVRVAGRRGRRLAAQLRGARALLRAGREGLGGFGPGQRHRLPARRGPADAPRAAVGDGPPGGQGAQRAGLALVARAQRDRHPAATAR